MHYSTHVNLRCRLLASGNNDKTTFKISTRGLQPEAYVIIRVSCRLKGSVLGCCSLGMIGFYYFVFPRRVPMFPRDS